MAHIRQLRLDCGLGVQVKVLETIEVVPTWLGSGTQVPRSQEIASTQHPTAGHCLGPYGGPKGVEVSCARGTPV